MRSTWPALIIFGVFFLHSWGSALASSSQLRIEIVQGVCKDLGNSGGKDEPMPNVTAKVSGSTEISLFKTGIDGRTAIPLPQNATKGMPETIVVLRGNELLEVIWPPNGNITIPDDSTKFVRLVVQSKGESSAPCSREVLDILKDRALATSAVQSAMTGTASVGMTLDALSRLAKTFEGSSFDWWPIGLLALEMENWDQAAHAFDLCRQYRMQKYQNGGGSRSSIADAAYLLGYSYFQLDEFEKAASYFKEANIYQPSVARTLASYAISLEESPQANFDDVYQSYARALEAVPPDEEASHPFRARLLYDFGGYLNNQGKYSEAKQELDEAVAMHKKLQSDSELADDYLELANTLHEKDFISPDAERYLSAAIDLLKDAPPQKLAIANYRLAAYWTDIYDKSNYAKAEDKFRSSCPVLPDDGRNLDHAICQASYAELLRTEGDCLGAKQAIERLHEKEQFEKINARPGGHKVAIKIGIIWQECTKANPTIN